MTPEAYNAEILRTLKSLDERTARIERAIAGGRAGSGAKSSGALASDDDLDGERGNPTIRKDPPRWAGESFVGCSYSECPSDYLENLAGFLEWKAKQNAEDPDEKKQKYASYDRRDAARARGWAARNRGRPTAAQRQPRSQDEPDSFNADDDIPF